VEGVCVPLGTDVALAVYVSPPTIALANADLIGRVADTNGD